MLRSLEKASTSKPAGSAVRTISNATGRRQPSLRIVITAGPTREYFDSVRFISNPSSGKMGYAIAEASTQAGHCVTLITGPVELSPPRGVHTIRVETAAEMLRATKRAFAQADAAIFAAAVCDYRPRRRATRKLPKKRAAHTLDLVPTEDIAAACGRVKGRRVTIAFALEDHDGRRHAEQKLQRKNCDAIVLNGPAAVGTDRTTVVFLVRGGAWESWTPASKRVIARRLVRVVERLWAVRLAGR